MLIERLRSSSNDSCTLYNVHTGSKTYRSVVVTTNDFICSEIAPHDKYCSMDNICVCKLKCAMLQWKCVCCSVAVTHHKCTLDTGCQTYTANENCVLQSCCNQWSRLDAIRHRAAPWLFYGTDYGSILIILITPSSLARTMHRHHPCWIISLSPYSCGR